MRALNRAVTMESVQSRMLNINIGILGHVDRSVRIHVVQCSVV